MSRKKQRIINSAVLFSIVFPILFVSLLGVAPKTAKANLPVINPVAEARENTMNIWEKIGQKLREVSYVMYRNAMNAFLGKIAYDTATWLATGDEGQKPLLYTDKPGDYLKDAADAAAGAAIESFANEMGFDAAALCHPSDPLFSIRLGLDLEGLYGPTTYYQPTCAFSDFQDNWDDFFVDPEFDKYVSAQWDPAVNPLGQALSAASYVQDLRNKEESAAALERLAASGGFKDVTEPVSGYILTPGSQVEEQLNLSQLQAWEGIKPVGEPLADSVSIFVNTFISKFSQRIQEGLLAGFYTGADVSDLISGSSGGTTAGAKAAEAIYSSLKEPSFITTGSYDILSDLGACPDEGASSINCVIDSTLQVAIQNKWTVREFIEYLEDVEGRTSYKFIETEEQQINNPAEGISYRAVLVLKKYRIVPVGWELAAEFILSGRSDFKPTLSEVMDCYNAGGSENDTIGDCQYFLADDDGVDTTYSPFYGLIDPDWTLKAPENYCKYQAPGPDIAYSQPSDSDGIVNTQEEVTISRVDYCADNRACIDEPEEGTCAFYGYCTEEKRIYRSDSEACEESAASCQAFENEEGETVSYLKNTINYNDCSTDPGCSWYCLVTDDNGNYICKDQDTVYNVCDDQDRTYYTEESCSCSSAEEYTCYVSATAENRTTCTLSNGATCELDDNCGDSYETYDEDLEQCLCSYDFSCDIEIDSDGDGHDSDSSDSQCDHEDEDGNIFTCDFTEDCTTEASTYTSAGYCSALNIGDDYCAVDSGQSTCTNDIGNTCSLSGTCGSDVAYDLDDGYCKCIISRDSCEIEEGSYSCTSDNANTVILGTEEESAATPKAPDVVYNTSINLDNNAQSCEEDEAGCSNFIRVLDNTNLLYNSTFSEIGENDELNDGVQDSFAFCAIDGEPCINDSECSSGKCIGWQQSGVAAEAIDDSNTIYSISNDYGNAILLPTANLSTDNISITIETNQALENRTFALAYRAIALTTESKSAVHVSSTGGDYANSLTYELDDYSTSYDDYAKTFTIDDGVDDTALTLTIYAASEGPIAIDIAQLSEASAWSSYSTYGENNSIHLLKQYAECEAEDIGCQLYSPLDQDDASDIPAKITNPYSDACGNGEDFTNATCDQCHGIGEQDLDYNVGCDYYLEVPAKNNYPLDGTYDAFITDPTERDGIKKRTGYYCPGTQTSSFMRDTDRDCTGRPVNNISIIPDTGTACSASEVGCEEYTNLDEVAAGGEVVEYYSYIKPCVKEIDPNTYTYHTWEGSDDEGYAMVLYNLKMSTEDCNDGVCSPCTNLSALSEDVDAQCVDNKIGYTDCGPDGTDEFEENPDCVKFYDDSLNVYYRYKSETITVSDECSPIRNSMDQRIYNTMLSESVACSAEANGCREYQGSDSGNVEQIINEDFSDDVTEDFDGAYSTSSESVFLDDSSLRLDAGQTEDGGAGVTTNNNIYYSLYSSFTGTDDEVYYDSEISAGNTYIINFWAKGSGELNVYLSGACSDGSSNKKSDCTDTWLGLEKDYYFTETGSSILPSPDTTITLDDDWSYYLLGPIILPESVDDSAVSLRFSYTGIDSPFTSDIVEGEGYIDNIILEESNSQYLIKDSFETCYGLEGCRRYKDNNGLTHYLKSFNKLCDNSEVGCEAMINTSNSDSEFTQTYLTENEFEADDVTVPYDQIQPLIYNEEYTCSSANEGCSFMGEPDVNEQTGIIDSMETVYKILEPDDYNSMLCEDPQLQCREYYSSYDGTVYFKDPGDRTCTYDSYVDQGVTLYGWFINDTDSSMPDCPKQYSYADSSQPRGAVCNSNSQELAGEKCNHDYDCYFDGWDQDEDPTPRCISRIQDNVNQTGDSAYDLDENLNFGWVGECAAEESGCSEYIDPNSPNIEEGIINNSFESDVRDNETGDYYNNETEDEDMDNVPDYWEPLIVKEEEAEISFAPTTNKIDFADKALALLLGSKIAMADSANIINGVSDIIDDIDSDISYEYFIQDSTVSHEGSNSLKFLTDNYIVSSETVLVERDKLYTLESFFRIPEAGAYDSNDSTDFYTKINIGALFINSDNEYISATESEIYFVANDLTVDYNSWDDYAEYIDDAATGYSEWLRISGNIGMGSTVEIPENTVYMQVFIGVESENTYSTESDGYVWFDSLSFKENDKYYLIDYTTDGTAERENFDSVHTCVDQDTEDEAITSDGGCVAFRDVLSDTQNYIQFEGEGCDPCMLTPNMDTCRYAINACDTNSVLKVTRDRICDEWISCETAQIFTDSSGNEDYVCLSLQPCNEMNEKGQCISWSYKPLYDELSQSHSLDYYIHSGDTDSLRDIQNKTGYVKVGLTWSDYSMCNGGWNNGGSCESVDDCLDMSGEDHGSCDIHLTTDGFYPYGWMYEVGTSGADTGIDLISNGNFEDLYCVGDKITSKIPCILNSGDDDEVDYSQCWTTEMETYQQAFEEGVYGDDELVEGKPDENLSIADYFCPNTPEFGSYFPFTGWSAYNSTDDKVIVSQYDNRPSPDNSPYEDNLLIDTNNVLQVTPTRDSEDPDIDETSSTAETNMGVQFDLDDDIQQGSYYTVSFKGRYADSFTDLDEDDPSLISVGLKHENIIEVDGDLTENIDWFIKGEGTIDVIFAIDTSGSMTTPIEAVMDAAPALAADLAAQDVTFRFGIYDLEDQHNRALDLTSNLSAFDLGMSTLKAEAATVNPPSAVWEIMNNNLEDGNSFNFNSSANKFIILVTDTYKERSASYNDDGTAVDIDDAEQLAAAAGIPVIIITDSNSKEYYETLASNSGGYSLDSISSSNWNTTEVEDGITLTEKLSDIILEDIESFQFTNELEQYTLGPIKIAEKKPCTDSDTCFPVEEESAEVKSNLIFITNNGDTFQIDDVSLLPVLETNKDTTPITRSCRAYADTYDKLCSYTEANGVQHKGWQGYCVEADPTNENRCITWWPLDVIAGETSSLSNYNRVEGGYDDAVNTFYCLVAKGYQSVGYCEEDRTAGEGRICQPDDVTDEEALSTTCNDDTCLQGAIYTLHQLGDDIDSPYERLITTDSSGDCEIIDNTVDYSCDAYPGNGDSYCYDSDGSIVTTYVTENSCEEASDDYSWEVSETMNIFTDFHANAECINQLFDPADYGGDSTISPAEQIEEDYGYEFDDSAFWGYCFYDSTGDGVPEVRTNYLCFDDLSCFGLSGEDAADYNCSPYACSENSSVQCNPEEECDSGDQPLNYSGEYKIKTRSWQMHDPWDAGDSAEGYGVISKMPANSVEKNIHISEIQSIDLYLGDAGDSGHGNDEGPFWGQSDGHPHTNGTITISNLADGAIDQDEPWSHCTTVTESNVRGAGCYWWGQYGSMGKLDEFIDPSEDSTDDSRYDLVYVYGWSNYLKGDDPDGVKCKKSSGDDTEHSFTEISDDSKEILESECFAETIDYVMNYGDNGEEKSENINNPWEHLEPSVMVDFSSGTNDSSDAETVVFDYYSDELDGWDGWDLYSGNHSGGNIFSIWLDYDAAGYLDNVYTMIWYGSDDVRDNNTLAAVTSNKYNEGVTLTWQDMMSLEYNLREPCALVAQAVSSNGDNRAWAERASGGNESDYYNNFNYSNAQEPWGRISDFDADIGTEWDTIPENDEDYQYQMTNYGQQSIFAFAPESTDDINAGTPYSCIGQCDIKYCVDGTKAGEECDSAGDCAGGGTCTGVGNDSEEVTSIGYSSGYSSYDEQLASVAEKGQDNFEHIFADIDGGPWWTDYDYGDLSLGIYRPFTGLWNSDNFKLMEQCENNERTAGIADNDEYCGIRPSVENIILDDMSNLTEPLTITSGESVKLSFDSVLDPEQEELMTIFIDWGDNDSDSYNWQAQSGNHTYTHAYGCSGNSSGYVEKVDGYCYYEGKITLVDNWGWCSGEIMEGYEDCDAENGICRYILEYEEDYCPGCDIQKACHTYDAFPVLIKVKQQ